MTRLVRPHLAVRANLVIVAVLSGAPGGPGISLARAGDAELVLRGAPALRPSHWGHSMAGPAFGVSIVSPGDVTGDGLGDVFVAAPGYRPTFGGAYGDPPPWSGGVFFYAGSVTGFDAASEAFTFVDGLDLGWSLAACDLKGDGVSHLLTVGFDGPIAYTLGWGIEVGIPSDPVVLATADDIGGTVGCGDLDGDGFDDIVLSRRTAYDAPEPVRGPDSFYVAFGGGATGSWSVVPVEPASPPLLGVSFGHSLALGDINGDGLADVVAAAVTAGDTLSTIHVFLGHAERDLVEWASYPFPTPTGDHVASGGDVNGDGYEDVISVTWATDAATIYHGGSEGLAPSATLLKPPAPRSQNDSLASAAMAGDLNADGFDDVIAGWVQGSYVAGGRVAVYVGSACGVVSQAWTVLDDRAGGSCNYGAWGCFGEALTGAGDLDGDGVDDLLVGSPTATLTDGYGITQQTGAVHTWYGVPGPGPTWFLDADGDGVGGVSAASAEPGGGLVASCGDCDDGDGDVWPGARERCNGRDDDCDGAMDEGCPPVRSRAPSREGSTACGCVSQGVGGSAGPWLMALVLLGRSRGRPAPMRGE